MTKHCFYIIISILSFGCLTCIAVAPASPDKIWEELASVKNIMSNIASQLEKFNSLYLSALELRMVSIASTMSSIDSNIKNLQERAHVWDTFQLHVAAWNEQINTLDKKVEIISKGQEKMFNLDGKMNSISNIEYKIERIIGKLDMTDNTLQSVSRAIDNQSRDPLLNEFTSRGVLSTLKIVERKVDRILTGLSNHKKNISSSSKKNNTFENDPKGKLLIKCNTPPIVEELLHDVSSKVDVIFDRMSSKYDDKETILEYDTEELESSIETAHELRSAPSEEKLVNKVWKKLTSPCKKTTKLLESFEEKMQSIDNSTFSLLEANSMLNYQLLNCCRNSEKEFKLFTYNANTYMERIENTLTDISIKEHNLFSLVDNHFKQHKLHLTETFKTYFNTDCNKRTFAESPRSTEITYGTKNEESSISETDEQSSTDILTTGSTDSTYKNYNNENPDCSELSHGYPSGIYVLGAIRDYNEADRDFYTRFCDMQTNGGGWTVIQRRGNFGKTKQNFSLSWDEYKYGFGSLDTEFWYGNEFIHRLVEKTDMVLRIELEDFEGNTAWAEYTTFKIDNEMNNYRLRISGYNGNASDSLIEHNNSYFSTYDRDNDDAPPCCPCAFTYGGGWWFYSCFESNLNGVYYDDPRDNDYFRGIIWEHWLGNYSLRKTQMLLRPKSFRTTNNTVSSTTPIPEDP